MTIDDRELDRRLASLTGEAEPDSRVWSAIDRRIRPAGRRWPTAVAAAVAVMALAVPAILVFRQPPPDRLQPVAAEVEAMRAVAPAAVPAAVFESSDALMAAWQQNRTAIDELERALERDPDNRLLLEFLAEARLRQARLVAVGMTHPTERRIDL